MHPPNFYSDDEWNDLTDDERQQSLNAETDEERLLEIIKQLEQEMKDFGPITGSDVYNDWRNLERAYQTYVNLFVEARRENRHIVE